MDCYLKENEFNKLEAKKTITEYEEEEKEKSKNIKKNYM